MKLITTTALALVSAVTAVPAAAQYESSAPRQTAPAPAPQQAAQAQPKITPSSKAIKAIIDLQAAVNKNDYASVPAKVAAAQAVASTKEDKYLIGQLQLKAALAAKDNAGMAAAIEQIGSSGYLDATKTGELYTSLGSTLYNNKQYAQAAAAYQKALAADPRNTDAPGLLGEALLVQGQKAEAVIAFQRAVQIQTSSGKKPDEALLKRAVSVAYEAQSPVAVELGRQWVAAYPGPDSWHNSIAIYRNMSHPDVEGTLDLLRLMQAAGALNSGSDYALFARAAAEQGNFNEAQAVIDAGIAAKLVNPADPQFRDIISGLKSKAKATPADLAVATKTAANGNALLRIGDRYYAMGDYAKAVESYRLALGKSGVDAEVVNLHIGMALARSGDKAGAITALNAVTGPRAEIAKFWLTYVNQKG
jgi:tetratricopeptide (TPR) repeat protein